MTAAPQVRSRYECALPGERVRDEEIHLWTFDDAGKISGMRHYTDTAKHIKAAKGSLAEVR